MFPEARDCNGPIADMSPRIFFDRISCALFQYSPGFFDDRFANQLAVPCSRSDVSKAKPDILSFK